MESLMYEINFDDWRIQVTDNGKWIGVNDQIMLTLQADSLEVLKEDIEGVMIDMMMDHELREDNQVDYMNEVFPPLITYYKRKDTKLILKD